MVTQATSTTVCSVLLSQLASDTPDTRTMPPKKAPAPKTSSKTPAKPAAKPAAKPGLKGNAGKKTETPSKTNAKGAAAAPAPPPPAPPEMTSIGLKELNTVIEGSTTGKIRADKKWPLIVDLQGSVATFFKYRDANYIQSELPGEMLPDKVRRALLGAIRFGKPLVIDVDTHDISDIQQLDEIEKGLMDSLLSHKILEDENYVKLARDEDDKEYHNSAYYQTEGFYFVVITTKPDPNPALAANFTCFKVE